MKKFYLYEEIECEHCYGQGYYIINNVREDRCPKCNGKGYKARFEIELSEALKQLGIEVKK